MRLIILSGLSGSGKSVALRRLEDLDYYCIDNIPAALLRSFIEEKVTTEDPDYPQVAVGIDVRARPDELARIPQLVEAARARGVDCEVVFLTAETPVLIKRYSETRRRHPLSRDGLSLAEAIEAERGLLGQVAESADLVLDTSRTGVHELRDLIADRVHRQAGDPLSLLFQSFGYKHGIPNDADFVFDVRCLPNPYWEPALKTSDGRDPKVIEYLRAYDDVVAMIDDIAGFLERWLSRYQDSGRAYLTVAVGCTGGFHRSVHVVESLAERFRDDYPGLRVRHSELP